MDPHDVNADSLRSWSMRFLYRCILLVAVAFVGIGVGLTYAYGPSYLLRESGRLIPMFFLCAVAISGIAFVFLFAVELLRRWRR